MYIVVKMFDDLQDTEVVGGIRTYHRYNVGDEYPREGYTPTTERVQSLLTGSNSHKAQFIGILEEKLPEEDTQKAPETAEAPKKAPAKRKRATPAKRKATTKKES